MTATNHLRAAVTALAAVTPAAAAAALPPRPAGQRRRRSWCGRPVVASDAAANDLSVTAYDKPTMRFAIGGARGRPGHDHVRECRRRRPRDGARELKPGVTLARVNAALH